MIYKARYISTGQFYKSTGKDNLSKKGKVYSRKPQWEWLHFVLIDGIRTETQPSDWEIVKYELTETGTESFE